MTTLHIHMILWPISIIIIIGLGFILRKPFRNSGNIVRILLVILTLAFGFIPLIIMIWPQKKQKKHSHKHKKINK